MAWLLTAVMVIGVLPSVALAEEPQESGTDSNGTSSTTVTPTISISNKKVVATVGETSTSYTLRLGQITEDGSLDTGTVSKIIKGSDTTTTINWYVLLLDSNNAEAPQNVYEALWITCGENIFLSKQTELETVTCSELLTDTDGYHKYITASIAGTISGEVVKIVLRIGEDGVGASGNADILIPTPLTLDENGQANFTIEDAQAYSHYCFSVNLDKEEAATVSAELTTENVYGRIDLDGGSILWKNFQDETSAVSMPKSVTAQQIVFLVRPFTVGTDGKISGTVQVEVEQPKLMFRYMNHSNGVWTEHSGSLIDISSLKNVELNNSLNIRLYYGTSEEYAAVDAVVSANTGVVTVTLETASDGNSFFRLSGAAVGHSGLTCSIDGTEVAEFTATVDLPSYGFYSENARTVENYLSSVKLTGAETDLTKVWFIGKGSLKNTETDVITVTAGDEDITSTYVKFVSDSVLEITLPTDMASSYSLSVLRSGSRMRGIKVVLSASDGGNQSGESGDDSGQNGYAAYIDEYVIGFAEKRADGDVTKICETSAKIFGHGTIENTSPNVPYQKEVDIYIAAAKKSADTTGTVIYEVDATVTGSVVINRLWVETHSGDNTTYSWSGDRLVTELTSVGKDQPVPLYVKEGRNCEATVCAQIAVTVDGQTYEKTVRMNIGLAVIDFSGLNRPENDTVEQLNAFLEELAAQINTADSKNEIYNINLGNTTYEGIIHVPAAFVRGHGCLHFDGATGNGRETVIKGSLDINGAFIERIQNIHFIADESSTSQTKAIFGGGLRDVKNCSFYGYDIALDSSDGLINASESVFVNNEIAAAVKINNSMDDYDVLPSDWNNNTFINNGSAVQILSLSKQVSPYYFRIYDSNFINNGTDIDARCGGTLYMYRNYFGQYRIDKDGHRPHPGKHHHDRHNGRDYLRLDELLNARTESKLNGLLDYTRAKISTKNGTKVIINPRWLHPVKDWWGHNALINDTFFGPEQTTNDIMTLDVEPEYKDILVADWENETVILNEESSTLTLDTSTFEGTEKKEIGIVDGEESEYLGTWIFD